MRLALVLLGIVVVATAGCAPVVSPELVRHYQDGSVFLCCNLHYENDAANDANYHVGSLLPVGTPVRISDLGRGKVTFVAEGRRIVLEHTYGTDQESMEAYLKKVFVEDDPRLRLASFPKPAREAIHQARVEVGMTREQVLLSLGYPPTHRTTSLSSPVWTYWYNRWFTYQVLFDEDDRVAEIVGLKEGSRRMVVGPSRGEPVAE